MDAILFMAMFLALPRNHEQSRDFDSGAWWVLVFLPTDHRHGAEAGVGAGVGRPDAEHERAPRARPGGRPPRKPRLAAPPPRKTAAAPPVLPTPSRTRSGRLERMF